MKKVLASVLAGTMVLSMAAAASAANWIGLEKATGSDRVYDLLLYRPDGYHVTEAGDEAINWSTKTEAAWNAYVKAYRAYENQAGSYDTVVENYFKSFASLSRAGTTVVDAYQDFRDAVLTDSNNTVNIGLAASVPAMGGFTVRTYKGTTLAGVAPSTVVYDNATYPAAEIKNIVTFFDTNSPSAIEDEIADLNLFGREIVSDFNGDGEYMPHKTSWDISDEDSTNYVTNMYTYGEDNVKEVKIDVWVKHGDSIRADVNTSKVSVSKKLVEKNWRNTDSDVYMFTLKAKADVRDFELSDFEVEFDVDNDDHSTYFLKGKVAYSDYREVDPDDRLTITKSDRLDNQEDGCVFYFNEPIDEEARINCNDYVDLYFDGNYGTDYENLLVVTTGIQEVEDFFQDYDIDYYDFVGTPKFARDVRVIIDADSDAYIYEYDKKTGDVVDITDECEYTSNGMEFKRKSFKTYVILEEPYEGGNVKAEKEPVAEEPDDTDEVEEPKDDTANEGSKPNPGTGAYPLF